MTKCVLAPESQHKLKGLVSLVPFSSLTQISATQRSIQSRKTHIKYLGQILSFGDDLAQLVIPKKQSRSNKNNMYASDSFSINLLFQTICVCTLH